MENGINRRWKVLALERADALRKAQEKKHSGSGGPLLTVVDQLFAKERREICVTDSQTANLRIGMMVSVFGCL